MRYHFRNLIFEGGGVKGLAYVGALSVLESRGILQDIERVGGTSAGAITALLIGLGYSVQEIRDVLWNMDMRKFLDSSWGVIRNTDRLLKDYGWYKGVYFTNWVSELIEKKTGSKSTTFEELEQHRLGRQLYLIGTNLSTGYAEIFSKQHTPNITLAEAVRVSMSIPLFFTAVRNENKEVCVDGGVLENYPIKLFDRESYIDKHFLSTAYYEGVNSTQDSSHFDAYVFNMETLGFRLDSSSEIKIFEGFDKPPSFEINDIFDYLKRLIATLLDSQQNRHLHSDDWQRTVYIDSLSVRTTDFDISDELKQQLVESGKTGTERYFQWFDNSNNRAVNRPDNMHQSIG